MSGTSLEKICQRLNRLFSRCFRTKREDISKYFSFSEIPSSARVAGRGHVTFLSFRSDWLHARGSFASKDARDQLIAFKESGLGEGVEVIPAAASANVKVFGWAYDGKVISSTLGFSMMLLALFASTYDGVVIPPNVLTNLCNVRCRTQKHKNTLDRMVSSVSGSFIAHRLTFCEPSLCD